MKSLFHEVEATRSLYNNNNLLKSGNILKNDEARVIDSNTRIAERLASLSRILQDSSVDEEFYEGFSSGLDAQQVEQLLGDSEDADASQAPVFDTQADLQITEEAQQEAEAILSAAREEADRIVASAQDSAQGIMEEARAKGHGEGYQAGYDEGLIIAREAEEKCARRQEELELIYNQKIGELEPQFVDKITQIYEQIFKVDLSDRKELVLYLLSNAIRNIEGGKTFLVHVSKDDYEYVSSHKDELTRGLPGTAVFEIIEDLTLDKSQCFIEADSGIFDTSLDVELSLLKKELALLSYRP